MRPIFKLLLAVAGLASILFLIFATTSYATETTIADITNDEYAQTIKSSLSEGGDRFSHLTITSVQYVEDTISVVKTSMKSGTTVWFVFEYRDNTLFLTNYSTGQFSENDFNQPYVTQLINNARSAN
ncbi:MAG: hypothetical protein WBO49_04665 [Candidatus Saccharimonas sp.]